MLHIEPTESSNLVMKKSIRGTIRLNINRKGQQFGFVGDYYVPSRLINDIEEYDYVEVDIVYNGEKWEAYDLRKMDSDE